MREFDKYKRKGAYHWKDYAKKTSSYSKHVDRVVKWVRKGSSFDIGAGDGLITHMLGAVGIDDNKIAVSLAKERKVPVELGSVYNLSGFKKFDNVLLLDVIEHLELPGQALLEIKKVMKEDSILYIVTPHSGPELDKYHVKEYRKEELVEFVESYGFHCLEITQYSGCRRMYGRFELCQ